jgi:hypothetical protein
MKTTAKEMKLQAAESESYETFRTGLLGLGILMFDARYRLRGTR